MLFSIRRSWAFFLLLSLSLGVGWGCGDQDGDGAGSGIDPGSEFGAASEAGASGDEQAEEPDMLKTMEESPDVLINGLTALNNERNTFIGGDVYLEIDEIFNPDFTVTPYDYPAEDANFFEKLDTADPGDPADGSLSRRFPCAGGIATPADGVDCSGTNDWVDWDSLAYSPFSLANHQLSDLDANNQSNPDSSSFPRKAGCVATSQVLSKMNLIDAGAANNEEMAYLMVRREDNNGDAGWYWTFTRIEPTLTAGTGPCKPNEEELLFDLTPGDVLVKGQFHPSEDLPLVEVYKVKDNPNAGPSNPDKIWFDVAAQAAIDYTNTALWDPAASINGKPSVRAAAVNTTPMDPGSWGLDGFGAIVTGSQSGQPALGIELVSEAAFDLDLFRNTDTCEAVAWGTIITRPSGSGGPNPDLKDLIAPTKLNFIKADAVAKVGPTCGSNFEVWAEDSEGAALAGLECKWSFACTGGTAVPPAGLDVYDGANCFASASPQLIDVNVSDPSTPASCTATLSARAAGTTIEACGVESDSEPVNVFEPPDAIADSGETCTSTFDIWAKDSQDSDTNGVECKWDFSCTGGTASPPTGLDAFSESNCFAAASPSNIDVTLDDPVNGSADCTATMTVRSKGQTDATCYETSPTDVKVYAPVAATPEAIGLCEDPGDPYTGAFSYDVKTETGGDGIYAYAWTFSPSASTASADSTSKSGTMNVTQTGIEYTAQLTITDSRDCSSTPESDTATPLAVPYADIDLSTTCNEEVVYESTSTDSQGSSSPSIECSWDILCTDGSSTSVPYSEAACAQSTFPLGNVSSSANCDVTLNVRDLSDATCNDTKTESITVYEGLSIDVNAAPLCSDPDGVGPFTGQFSYSAQAPVGGSGGFTYQWEFTGPGNTSQQATDPTSGYVYVDQSGSTSQYTAKVTVTDSANCTAEGSNTATPLSEPSVEVSTTPSCDPEFGYDGSLTDSQGRTGSSVEVECLWSFSCTDGTAPADIGYSQAACADGTAAVSNLAATGSTCTAQLSVRNPSSIGPAELCTASNSANVTVYPALQLSDIDLTGTCSLEFDASATASGGSGNYGYKWNFSPPGDIDGLAERTGTTTGPMSENVDVLVGNQGYSALLAITDLRQDLPAGTCTTDKLGGPVDVYAPISFNLGELSDSGICVSSDAGTFSANNVTGGDGNYEYNWSVLGCPTGNEADCLGTGCDTTSATCLIDPPDNQFCPTLTIGLSIDDGTELCPAAAEQQGTYSKATTVSTSILP